MNINFHFWSIKGEILFLRKCFLCNCYYPSCPWFSSYWLRLRFRSTCCGSWELNTVTSQGAWIPEEWLCERTKASSRKSLLMHKLQLAEGKGKHSCLYWQYKGVCYLESKMQAHLQTQHYELKITQWNWIRINVLNRLIWISSFLPLRCWNDL